MTGLFVRERIRTQRQRLGAKESVLTRFEAERSRIILNFGVILPFLFLGVWVMNRRAVRKNVEPRSEELEKLHRELQLAK